MKKARDKIDKRNEKSSGVEIIRTEHNTFILGPNRQQQYPTDILHHFTSALQLPFTSHLKQQKDQNPERY
ncbi:hypothetical protein SCA6_018332 [Theobroma cacao]